ncbi:YkoF family thiamine/hydroxymethylpyrimidine-binding protein [Paenibacillus massiliensis]|uniref:YkoF family thiamine/hydroxymethylpyrimidine-binding protein n=1 Tax=Paenibacillus massiliensis TaxID=225917 RepID=UPI000684AEC9|nr:YkoF family thiamine/hydroxymethylpyrimidine-binding protein [Paenibacillus massiliensis]
MSSKAEGSTQQQSVQGQACGTSRIVGCRFSLYPMSNHFVDIIMDALSKVDTSKVWSKTDDVSTCIRGRMEHVFDVTKAIFLQAANSGEHVVLNGTFSIGCPGDTEGDVFMSENDQRMNEMNSAAIPIQTAAQFALYPMGTTDYMKKIYGAVEIAQEHGTFGGGVHYASRLDGDANRVFATLEQSFTHTQESVSHVVMTVNLSCNSPSSRARKEEA